MKFVKAELHHYKRIGLGTITHISYVPEQKMQIILGTNGSGKSSLLHELSVIPTNRAHYNKGGYKVLEIAHNKSYYILRSDYDKGVYSFKKDGEELNNGGTRSAQITLAEEHFGVTPKLQDLMLGVLQFTNMSVADRKYWFSLISDSDHTYSLKVFKKLSNRLRDLRGSIKISRGRLATEAAKLLTAEQEEELVTDKKSLEDELDYLLINKRDVPLDKREVSRRITQLDREAARLTQQLNTDLLDTDISSLNKQLATVTEQHRQVAKQIDTVNGSLIEYKDKVDNLPNASQSIASLEQDLSVLKRDIDTMSRSMGDSELLKDPETLYTFINTSLQPLIGLLSDLVELTDEDTLTDIGVLRKRLQQLQYDRDILVKKLSETETYSDLYKQVENKGIMCSECGTPISRSVIKLIKQNDASVLESQITEIDKEISATEIAVERSQKRSETLSFISNTINTLASYNTLGWIRELFDSNPQELLNRLNFINSRQAELVEYVQKRKKIKELTSELELAKSSDTKLLEEYRTQISRLEKELEELYSKQKEYRRKMNDISSAIKEIEKQLEYKKRLDVINNEEIPKLKEMEDIHHSNGEIDRRLLEVRRSLSDINNVIENNNKAAAVVAELEAGIQDTENRLAVIEKMLTALSPTEGLIAESILASMYNILDYMNNIIETIWTYKLKILPCITSEDDQDLTYKFPVEVADNDIPVPDIGLCSSSMQEIINLAFKITVMIKLNLIPYPLYLDEFGRSFDPVHREKAYKIVNDELLTANEFSQVFMVSHFMENYGSLTNADVVVIGEDNAEIPTHLAGKSVYTAY